MLDDDVSEPLLADGLTENTIAVPLNRLLDDVEGDSPGPGPVPLGNLYPFGHIVAEQGGVGGSHG